METLDPRYPSRKTHDDAYGSLPRENKVTKQRVLSILNELSLSAITGDCETYRIYKEPNRGKFTLLEFKGEYIYLDGKSVSVEEAVDGIRSVWKCR